MDKYLKELGYNFWEKSIVLTDGLLRLIGCSILNDKDIVLLSSSGQFIPGTLIENPVDRCKYEDSENHIHIDAHVAEKMNFNDLHFLGLGLEFAKQLAKKLEKEYPQKNFRISLSFGKVEDSDVYEFGNCVVRFYTIRAETEKIFKISDLDSFKEEGIIEIETKN